MFEVRHWKKRSKYSLYSQRRMVLQLLDVHLQMCVKLQQYWRRNSMGQMFESSLKDQVVVTAASAMMKHYLWILGTQQLLQQLLQQRLLYQQHLVNISILWQLCLTRTLEQLLTCIFQISGAPRTCQSCSNSACDSQVSVTCTTETSCITSTTISKLFHHAFYCSSMECVFSEMYVVHQH